MTTTMAYPDAVPDSQLSAERSEILTGQVQNFRRQLFVVGVAQAANAGLLAGVFYQYANSYLLAAWVFAVWCWSLLCVRSWWRYRDRMDEAVPKPGYVERAIRST